MTHHEPHPPNLHGHRPEHTPTEAAQPSGRTHSGRDNIVVVGLDSSHGSRNAVRWAAAEAARRKATLRLVYAYMPTFTGDLGYHPTPHDLSTVLRARGKVVVDRFVDEINGTYPNVDVHVRLLHREAVIALRQESENATLTVVGSRGNGRVKGIVVGSVAMALTSSNPAPVAVVHSEQDVDADGPVVVGVDGTPNSEAALAFAFEEASLRQTGLMAVHSWNDNVPDMPLPDNHVPDSAGSVGEADLQDEESGRAPLSRLLAAWSVKYPNVPVEQKVSHRRPTQALLKYGKNAQLIVVGSRGRGGVSGMLLGSTSHALVTSSECPVVVVRPGSLD